MECGRSLITTVFRASFKASSFSQTHSKLLLHQKPQEKVISAHGVTCKVWRGTLKRMGRTVPVAVKAMQLALDDPNDQLVVGGWCVDDAV